MGRENERVDEEGKNEVVVLQLRCAALRGSMLALMARTDKPHFAHPAFWAPFVVVGEGK